MSRTKGQGWDMSGADAVATRVLVLALAVGYPVLVILPRLIDWVRDRPLDWATTLAESGPEVPGVSSPGVTVTYGTAGLWHIDAPTAFQRAAALLPSVFTAILLALGCAIAWRLIGAARRGEPFGPQEVRRLRVLAVLVIAYGVLVPSLGVLASLGVIWSIDPVGTLAVTLDPSVVAVPLAIGMLVLVVAECFRIGTRLRDDVAGLV